MKRCPKCKNDFSDDANFCPVDAGHLVPIEAGDASPALVPKVDTGGQELLAGRFALGDIIGGHRTGPVYQAGDKQGSSAIVKIVDAKVFPTSLLKQRTERELAQLENLQHENVARILGHGRRDDAIWIASEVALGVTLNAFIAQEGPLSQSRSLKILRQIGGALEAAAKLGVTHRDLSPKNILLTADDSVKIINFGVPVPGEIRPELQGVPEFIAPEQFDGRPVDQRSNIFSLGAVAYVLLSGTPPFSGSVDELKAAHDAGPSRSLGEKEGVSAELCAVLLKSLEKSSSKRYMTLRQFLGGLEEVDGVKPSTSAAGGKKKSGMNAAKTLMGLAPIDAKAVQNAVGTPAPSPSQGEAPEPGGTADYPAAILRKEEQAETTLDSKTPEITPEVLAAAQASAAPGPMTQHTAPTVVSNSPPPATAAQTPVSSQVPAGAAAGNVAPAKIEKRATGKGAGKNKKKTEKKASSSNKGKFRETMWFKKGELDEAAAKAAAQAKPEDQVSAKADEMEMDERYKDDGSITQTDKERLSLQTGSTMMMEAIPEQAKAKPSTLVSEADLVSEMTSGRNKIIGLIAFGAIAIGIVLAIVLS